MPQWLIIFMVLAGSLLLLKLSYAILTAIALPSTQGALYVSTPRSRIAEILQAVPMQKGQLLIDLGCGDGRVLRMADSRYNIRAVGFELNFLAYLKARLQCLGHGNITVRMKNFRKADLSSADVIFCYLFPDVMKDLAEKFQKELKPGALIVSCNFALPGFVAERVLRPGRSGSTNDPVFIYRV